MGLTPISSRNSPSPVTQNAPAAAADQTGAAAPAAPAQPAAGGLALPADNYTGASRAAAADSSASGQVPGTLRRSRPQSDAVQMAAPVTDARGAAAASPQAFNKDGSVNPEAIKQLGQDNNANLNANEAHASCAATATVAALAMRGKDAMLQALANLKVNVSGHDRKDMGKLDDVEKKIRDGTATTKDLNEMAAVLHNHYDTHKGDKIVDYLDIQRMQHNLGLGDGFGAVLKQEFKADKVGTVDTQRWNIDPSTAKIDPKKFAEGQKKVSQDVLNSIPNGQTAIVAVSNSNTPPGMVNHAVSVGKTDKGEVFVYDPGQEPHMRTGQQAKDFLTSHIGYTGENRRDINPNQRLSESRLDAIPSTQVILHEKQVIDSTKPGGPPPYIPPTGQSMLDQYIDRLGLF